MCTTMKPHFTAGQEQKKDGDKFSIQDPWGPFLYLDRKIVFFFKKVAVKNKQSQSSRYTKCKTEARSIKMFIKTVISI